MSKNSEKDGNMMGTRKSIRLRRWALAKELTMLAVLVLTAAALAMPVLADAEPNFGKYGQVFMADGRPYLGKYGQAFMAGEGPYLGKYGKAFMADGKLSYGKYGQVFIVDASTLDRSRAVVAELPTRGEAADYSGYDDHDPAYGAWSVAHAEWYAAKYSRSSFAGSEPVDDPVFGALSIAHARFLEARGDSTAAPTVAARSVSTVMATTFSGDDDYDPAAGGTPGQSVAAVASVDAPEGCVLPAEEIARRSGLSVTGGYGGDDDYDPAAGGMPELSVAGSGGFASLLAACTAAVAGS